MKRPTIVVIDDTEGVRNSIKDEIEGPISEESGVPWEVIALSQCPEDLSKINDALAYFIDYSLPGKKGHEIAEELREMGAQGKRILMAADLPKAMSEISGMDERGLIGRFSKGREAEGLIAWQESGASELFPQVLEKPFRDKKVFGNITSGLREDNKLVTLLNVGIVGLGQLGLGTLQELTKEPWISGVEAYTGFVNGSQDKYQELLDSLDLPGEEREKVTTHSNLEGLVGTNPDVIVIATGEHNTPYAQYNDRKKLTERLFRKGLPKINAILQGVIATDCKSLLAMESNPNGQFIHHAIRQGIDPSQLTSFSPDTMRHVRKVYETLKKKYPDLTEDEISLMVVGDHMKGGTPIYHEATVKGETLRVFDPRFAKRSFQNRVTKKAREEGLKVMQSAVRYGHDYRGVPRKVRESLQEIAHLQNHPRYSVYAGLVSLPATFVYSTNNGTFFPRVKPTHKDLTKFTGDRYVIRELKGDVKRIRREVREWTKN